MFCFILVRDLPYRIRDTGQSSGVALASGDLDLSVGQIGSILTDVILSWLGISIKDDSVRIRIFDTIVARTFSYRMRLRLIGEG